MFLIKARSSTVDKCSSSPYITDEAQHHGTTTTCGLVLVVDVVVVVLVDTIMCSALVHNARLSDINFLKHIHASVCCKSLFGSNLFFFCFYIWAPVRTCAITLDVASYFTT